MLYQLIELGIDRLMINITTAARGISKTLKNYILTALYRVDQNTDPQQIKGNIDSTGYITGKKCGVFAYLQDKEDTFIDIPGQWYYIRGIFVNNPIEDFQFYMTLAGQPAIMYVGDMPMYFQIDWHGSGYAAAGNTNVSIAIFINGQIQQHSIMTSFSKFRDQTNVMSGTDVVLLSTGDYVQLFITADQRTDITVINFTTTIRQFYD